MNNIEADRIAQQQRQMKRVVWFIVGLNAALFLIFGLKCSPDQPADTTLPTNVPPPIATNAPANRR